MRQATGIGERNFQRTSNQRNETMMKEASDFASHLKKCDRAIADMKSSCETVLSTTKIAMNAPLPRLFEDTAVRGVFDSRNVLLASFPLRPVIVNLSYSEGPWGDRFTPHAVGTAHGAPADVPTLLRSDTPSHHAL